MNSHSELQSLIADLDSLLLTFREQDELEPQCQVLEKLRSYLLTLQYQSIGPAQSAQVQRETAHQIAQGVTAEIKAKLDDWLGPMHTEVAELSQQRSSLLREIRNLEKERSARLLDLQQESESEVASETIETISSLTDLLKPDSPGKETTPQKIWYLGIDFGTTGLSAVLFNHNSGNISEAHAQKYPIYWSSKNQPKLDPVSFRLPVKVRKENSTFKVGVAVSETSPQSSSLELENFKPYLNLGIPYYFTQQKRWEPQLQITEESTVPLKSFQQALAALLSTLKLEHEELAIGVVGLSQESFQTALQDLAGVVLNCPVGWGETYRFNLREAVLQAKLVEKTEQIFFLEEAIAALLGYLPLVTELDSSNIPITTLIVHTGATGTELGLVDLPKNLQDLSHANFNLHSFAYGGDGLDQDIFCQLIYPQWKSQLPLSLTNLEERFPQPGKPELDKRNELDLLLNSYSIGNSCLEAAQLVKLVLQQRKEFVSPLENQQWGVKRRDLDFQVIEPYWQQLNQKINQLLDQTGTSPQVVKQVICSGGMMLSFGGFLPSWVATKFPNASLIQDNSKEGVLRVAQGLACLPSLPLILDIPTHQYNDYFLLFELLKTIPNYPFTESEFFQLLRQRGINTRVCQERLLAFLKGKFPPGLIPAKITDFRLSQESQTNLDYQTLAASSLFYQDEQGQYHPHLESHECLQQYLTELFDEATQQLTEPLIINLSLVD